MPRRRDAGTLGMVVLAVFGLVAAAMAVTLLPVPVWVSRALRKPSAHRALRAAEEPAVAPEHARAVAELLTEINTAIDLAGRARDSMADYAAAVPLAWLLDRVGRDNWARATTRRSQYDEGEAAKAIERVVQALADAPDEWAPALEGGRDSLAALFSEFARAEAHARPGRRLPRAEARRQVALYESTVSRLIDLRGALTKPARDPYRR